MQPARSGYGFPRILFGPSKTLPVVGVGPVERIVEELTGQVHLWVCPEGEVKSMARVTMDVNLDHIKGLIFQLPVREFLALVEEIEERAETITMMQLAETGFREWDDEGEDIYDAEAKARRSGSVSLHLRVLGVSARAVLQGGIPHAVLYS